LCLKIQFQTDEKTFTIIRKYIIILILLAPAIFIFVLKKRNFYLLAKGKKKLTTPENSISNIMAAGFHYFIPNIDSYFVNKF